MGKFALRPTILCFFAFLWLFAAINPVYGGGSRDPDLSRADELIKGKEYDEAILVLSDFARRNPNNFDQAQQRLRRISRIRAEFNRYADELIDTLLNDPENSEKILSLTRRLYSLEKETSPVLANFVSGIQEIAAFNVSRNRLREVMQRGRELLERGDCAGAIQAYSTGMDIMRDEFFAASYSEATKREVIRETERVNTTVAAFRQTSAQMGELAAELTRVVNTGELAGISEGISRLNPAMDRFIALSQNLYTAVSVFDRILNEIRSADPEMGDRNHLSFLSALIHGRQGEAIQEGMLGAFETYWRNSVGSVLTAFVTYIQRMNSTALTAFNEGNYSGAVGSLGRVEIYVNLTPQFFQRHFQFNRDRQAQAVRLFGNTVLSEDIPSFVNIRALNEANNFLIQAGNAATNRNINSSSLENWRAGTITAAEAFRLEQQTRNTITEIHREIDAIQTRAAAINTEINTYHSSPHIANALDAIEKLRTSLAEEERRAAMRYYTIANQALQDSLPARRSEMERGRNFLEGQRRTNEDGVVAIHRFPAEALAELTTMLAAVTVDIENGNTVLRQFTTEPASVTSNRELSNLRSNYQNAINELTGIRTQGIALEATARSRSALAETHRQEGERLLREANAAFQRQDYETARERIQRASERFNNSLEVQESATMRQSWDSQLLSLGQAIIQAENELVIVEVRNLVNSARALYFDGNFQQAEDSLVRARNRWRITNPDENEEVLYWLNVVHNAITANTGRVIAPTAPLYAEMSQLLSHAQRNFNEGVRFINAGRRTDGIAKFDEARQLTREVKLMFPINEEAGLLELRMEQITDPTTFNASFEQRLRAAIEGTKQRSIESFADLQNLAEINPRYPNIRGIITQAEIDMGYRQPPPNPANIARSRELTASANRILEGNISTQYEVALAQIDQAISLNPDNAEAARVKDRLLNRMSVPGAIVLSSADEEDYQRAIRELQAGNNLVAFALVERLMQNPRNRNIAKLVSLQQRIQSVLN